VAESFAALADNAGDFPEGLGTGFQKLTAVMARLRRDCPWDAQQTHRSLTRYLVEETGEVLDAIETGSDTDLREELGDLLLQVVFHSEIARTENRFDIDQVATQVAQKLIDRHPYVFGDADIPEDQMASWEQAKMVAKHRKSALEGIPHSVNALARAVKVASRVRDLNVPVPMPDEPITAEETGAQILALVQRAQASGIDADQATRDALRAFESQVVAAETTSHVRPGHVARSALGLDTAAG
jgi:XTP/dITP diphosphohydrolase